MKKLKILIIDSSPIINIGFKSIFKNSVIFEVAAFTDNKNEIYDIVNQLNIDLVISEINFKNGSIRDVLKIFKKNNIQIPLVVFTSESNENKSISILKAGASGFITKNLRKKSIKQILQDIAFSKYGSKELNKFTRLKNRFNYDYNTEKLNSLSKALHSRSFLSRLFSLIDRVSKYDSLFNTISCPWALNFSARFLA